MFVKGHEHSWAESRYFSNGRGHPGFATFAGAPSMSTTLAQRCMRIMAHPYQGRRGSIVVVIMPYLRLAQLAHGDGSL